MYTVEGSTGPDEHLSFSPDADAYDSFYFLTYYSLIFHLEFIFRVTLCCFHINSIVIDYILYKAVPMILPVLTTHGHCSIVDYIPSVPYMCSMATHLYP